MCHNLFIRALIQVSLVSWFFQAWRHFSVNELFNDRLNATPKASFANFWSSFKKSNNFWFAGLKTSRSNLWFTVAID